MQGTKQKSDNADQTKDPKIGVNDDMRNLIDTHIKRHRKRRKRGRIERKKESVEIKTIRSINIKQTQSAQRVITFIFDINKTKMNNKTAASDAVKSKLTISATDERMKNQSYE